MAVINNLAHVLSDLGRNEEALALVTPAAAAQGSSFAAALREARALVLQRLGRARQGLSSIIRPANVRYRTDGFPGAN